MKENSGFKIKRKRIAGITLISLVVTIIVLLILAGISISMLSGDNSILNRTIETGAINAYRNAEEQVKLAYAALKTEIMTQKVSEGMYSATDNTEQLGNIVLNELVKSGSKFTVDTAKEGVILIKYEDKSIIKNTVEEGKPAQNGKVVYTITLQRQDATLKADIGYSLEVEEKLAVDTKNKISPWVQFKSDNQEIAQKYRVLYDASVGYGIEIISATNIGENYLLGKNDVAGEEMENAGNTGSANRAVWSYQNAIETLNKVAESRVNISDHLVDSIRCIGSKPSEKNYKNYEKYTSTNGNARYFPNKYNGIWDKSDNNYENDYNQMGLLNLRAIGESYWVASKISAAGAISSQTDFTVRKIRSDGIITNGSALFNIIGSGRINPNGGECGIRPVLHLTPNIRIINGEGTEDSPYVLD